MCAKLQCRFDLGVPRGPPTDARWVGADTSSYDRPGIGASGSKMAVIKR